MIDLVETFERDAGARLKQMLVARQIPRRARFTAAAQLAGRQLEWLKPVVLRMTPKGPAAGLAAAVEPGTILVVLADQKQVFTIYLRARDQGWIDDLDAAAEHVRQQLPRPWEPPLDTFKAIDMILGEHGGPPGVRAKDLRPATLARIMGVLLIGVELEERHELLGDVAQWVGEGVCSALVGLLVRRAEALTGVWPLVVPVAPYAAIM